MAGFCHDDVLDAGLALIDANVDELYICNALPTDYTEASSTYAIGNKKPPVIGVPEDLAGGGRKVVVSAITDGTVTADDTATHWALCKAGTTKLYVANTLSVPKDVAIGIPFTLAAFDVHIPDVA